MRNAVATVVAPVAGAKPQTILVVENPETRSLLCRVLEEQRYEVIALNTLNMIWEWIAAQVPDLVILGCALPRGRVQEVCRHIRLKTAAPILVLSKEYDERSCVAALDSGADDYVPKPFLLGELLARIRVLLRRASVRPSQLRLSTGEVRADRQQRRVWLASRVIRLTRTEFNLLVYLLDHPDRTVTPNMISHDVLGVLENRNAVRTQIANLRKKIEPTPDRPRYILTERGIGYRLGGP